MALSPVILILIAIGLVLLNGFFVAAEFAIVKVRRTQLETRIARGERRAKVASHVVDHLDAYLSATQLGITLASLSLGWIGEPAVARLLGPPLHAAGIQDEGVVEGISFAVGFFLITVAHIVVGELAPKTLAIQRAEQVTLWVARPLRLFRLVFQPLIWALNGLAGLILKALGVRPLKESELVQSEEELRLILASASGHESSIDARRAEIIERTFALKDLDARAVMTRRTKIVALDVQAPFEAMLARAEESEYTRFPLIDGELDRVLGFAHYRDLIRLARSSGPRDLSAIRRPVVVVPETKRAAELLAEMLQRNVHMSVIIDEFGSTTGLVTLEDLLEELLGEIRDEFDVELETMREESSGVWVVDATTSLQDASRLLKMPLASRQFSTLGGYVIERLGRIPAKGERFKLGAFDVTVREADRRRIVSLEVARRADEAPDE